ncbi:MAG: tail fiber domain-containing protein [Pyrinomonadaceae bacterium]
MRSGNKQYPWASFGLALAIIILTSSVVGAQTTSFTYQGRLRDSGAAANGTYDLQFALFDSASGGTQIGATQTVSSVAVSAGIFSVQLDFGATAFPGANRFLEISARLTGAASFITLSPRQQITSTPYAIRSGNATTADTATTAANATNATNATTAANATQLGGVAASQYVVTNDSRLIDSRAPTAGSVNYVQNQTASTQAAGFNIGGNGIFGGNVGIGTATPQTKLTVQTGANSYGVTHTDGTITVGSFVGLNGGWYGTKSNHPLFFFANNSLPQMTLTPDGDVGIGITAPTAKLDVRSSGPAVFGITSGNGTGVTGESDGSGVGVEGFTSNGVGVSGVTTGNGLGVKGYGTSWFTGDTTPSLNSAVTGEGAGVAIGSQPFAAYGYVFAFDYKPPGSPKILALNHFGGFVGVGTNAPTQTLDVAGRARIRSIPLVASTGTVCFNAVGDLLQCGASSLRWKINVSPFLGGLDIVRRLRPINFNWKESGAADIGLGAEDVAKIAPSLTFINSKGEAEGVKYERLNIVLINAIKEQQNQIETLKAMNATLNARLRSVEKVLRKRVGSRRRQR